MTARDTTPASSIPAHSDGCRCVAIAVDVGPEFLGHVGDVSHMMSVLQTLAVFVSVRSSFGW